MKLNLKSSSSTTSALIYGPPKTGKTKLVGQLSSEFDLIWFDLENGSETLHQLSQSQQERIELVSIPDSRSYPIAIETCLKVIKGAPCNICEEHGKIDCALCKKSGKPFTLVHLNALPQSTIVVFDSLTQLTNSAISHITKDKTDDYKMQFDDWGNLGKLMDIFLSHVQVAKFNVVCISHETEAEQEDGTIKIVPTAGTRNFSRNTAKYFGHVVYASVKNKKHQFLSSTTASLNIITGSRTDVVTEKMNEPSLLPIFRNRTQPSLPIQTTVVPLASTVQGEGVSASPVKETTGTESPSLLQRQVDTRTPGQTALDRLKGLSQK